MNSVSCRLANGLVMVTLSATPAPGRYAEVVRAFARQHEHEALDTLPVLIDATRPDLEVPSFLEIRDRVRVAATLAPPLSRRWALVVSTPLHYGKGNQYATLIGFEGIDMRVFMTQREALKWLGWEVRE